MSKPARVFIANRGEIARRIQRACRELGYTSIQAVSEADRHLAFAKEADEVSLIGPAAARDSYLNIGNIVAAALQTQASCVHPGYGFLSENPDFAEAVCAAGLVFVGPRAEAIRLLGSKTEARKLLQSQGVPTTAGVAGGLSDQELIEAAKKLGLPVIIKAVAGGGGRGMRVVKAFSELESSLKLARAEAQKFFANADVYFERYIENPRHVEVQIAGDNFGKVLHFGTRECSVQRRHQKLIEEAPAQGISEAVREKLHTAAVIAGKTVNYNNVGTAEFLVAGEDVFFLEMNTRIQVEHPVTEEVTGIDLVKLQFEIANNRPIALEQSAVRFTGHAIEYRIYAEDPANNFMPTVGELKSFPEIKKDYVREERGYTEGESIGLHYDAMLAKLIVKGTNRDQAIARSREVLFDFEIKGPTTSLDFHRWALLQADFITHNLDIAYVDRVFKPESLNVLKVLRAAARQKPSLEKSELPAYKSKKYKQNYLISCEQDQSGLYIFSASSAEGQKLKPEFAVISNTAETGREKFIKEVLESYSPEQLLEAGPS